MDKTIKILTEKKLIYNKTKKLKNFFKKKNRYFYLGIDPTNSSLHLGHLLGITIINKLYSLGFKKCIIVIGEATTKISSTYNNKLIKKNIYYLKKQLLKLTKNNKIIILNNIKWFKNIKFINFVKTFFPIYSINSLLKIQKNKDMINKKSPINFSNFIYHILQAYDYLYLYKKFNCTLEIGGSDQWYNILSGIKLIKKKCSGKAYGFTFPLLLNNEGYKFSKSNKLIKNIWVSKNKTSVFDLYQFFINLSDNRSINYFIKFSNKKIQIIKKIIKNHIKNKKKRYIQKYLARFFITWIYGKRVYKEIKKIIKSLFVNKFINNIDISLLKKYIRPIKLIFNKEQVDFYNIIKKTTKVFKSYKEYNNFKKNNGLLLINGKKIKGNTINIDLLIEKRFLIIKKGKKDFYLLKIIFTNE